MRIKTAIIAMLAACAIAHAEEHHEKSIYIPRDLDTLDLNDPASKWSYRRMASTENVVLFWAPGFGDNISAAPELEGHNMQVDLANLLARLENFYHFFYDNLAFARPGSKADRYKMMVMLDYSLEGTAYGGDYDGEIGALWIAPNRVQDKKLNCIAHELGHSFQSQITCDGDGDAWGGHGIFEMASQWMLWRVNPDWPTDENYHLNAFRDNTHRAFLSIENIYRSPYILEYWAEKRGDHVIADLFRAGRVGDDPVMTYKEMFGLSQEQFCDEMYYAVSHLVNWDLDYARENMRPYANKWHTQMESVGGKSMRPVAEQVPEDYGFNFISLDVPAPGQSVEIAFEGLSKDKDAGWRYGLVAVDRLGAATYTPTRSERRGKIKYTAPVDGAVEHLWLVVMGAPAAHVKLPEPGQDGAPRKWNYQIKV